MILEIYTKSRVDVAPGKTKTVKTNVNINDYVILKNVGKNFPKHPNPEKIKIGLDENVATIHNRSKYVASVFSGVPFISFKVESVKYKTAMFVRKVEKVKEEKVSDFEDGPVTSLDISTRYLNALLKAGYEKISDLRGISVEELTAIRGIGTKTAEEIVSKLD